jgi:hypothetical protein
MADSIEQKIISRAVAAMQTIRISNGYHSEVGARVEDSRPNWDQEDDLADGAAISIFQGSTETVDLDDEAQMVLRKLPLMFKGFLVRGTDAASARKLISDIHTILRSVIGDKWIVSSVPLAVQTDESSHGIDYAPDTFEVTGIEVAIEVFYRASKFNTES